LAAIYQQFLKFEGTLEVLEQNGYKVIHLTDGDLLTKAVAWVESGKAEGINLNFIRNHPSSLGQIKDSKQIRLLTINDYDHKKEYDYSAIHKLGSLKHLSIYTTDNKEIEFSAFSRLRSAAVMWRPKAKSLYERSSLKRLFLGKYKGQDLKDFHKLKQLEYLRLNTGSVVSLDGLSEFEHLEELWLMQCTKLEDISAIKLLKNLKYLRIDNCRNVRHIEIVKKLNIPVLEIVGTTPS